MFKGLFQKQEKKEPKQEGQELITGFNSILYSDRSFTHYDPDQLRINKGNQVYSRMMTDEQVKAVLNFKKSAVVARGYSFDVSTDDEEQQRIADFFHTAIDEMTGSFTEKLKFIMSAMENGFSICEKVYENIEFEGSPYWGIDDIKLKSWDTFTFEVDKYGSLESINQEIGFSNATPIPQEKVIHWVNQPEKDRYYGESDLRTAYRAWWSKDIAIRFQNIHLERHGSGFTTVRPGEKSKVDDTIKNKLISIVKNLSIKTGIYLPKGYDLKVHSPERTDAYEKAVAQHDKSIAKSMLVPNLLGLSEQGQTGSYSQSQTQFDVFLWIINDICLSLAEALNEQLFSELALWNFGTNNFPKFQFDPMTEAQKVELAKTWSELVQKGSVTNSDQDEAHTRNLLGYPKKSEEEEIPEEENPIDSDGPMDEFSFAASTRGEWMRRVDHNAINKNMDESESLFVSDLSKQLALARLSIENQIRKIAGQRSFGNIDPREFENIAIPKAILTRTRKAIRKNLKSSFNENYNRAAAELPKKINADQVVGMDRTQADRFLASKSIKVTDVINNDVLKAVNQVLENGIKFDKTLKDIMLALETDTDLVALLPEVDAAGRAVNIPARLENIARTNISDAVNQSRQSLFGRPEFKGFIQAYEYSAILDDRTSEICETLDGRIRKDWGSFTPPNHFHCRSILVPVTVVDDWNGTQDNIPSTTKPLKGFA